MDNFVFHSRKINFIDTNNDPFLESSKLRKIAALNFFSAVELGEDPETISSILESDLSNYGKVVDEPNGVNNYANQILQKLPNRLDSNQSLWKISITPDRIAEILVPLPCSSHKSDKWDRLNCSNATPSTPELNKLLKAFTSYNNVEAKPVTNIASGLTSSEHSKGPSLSKTTEEPKRFVPKMSIFKKPTSKNQSQPGTSSKVQATKRRQETEPAKISGYFKSASEELKIQNLKKHGKEDNQYSYGTNKKSLGTRKGSSVNSKFQPPVLRKDGEENESCSRDSAAGDEVDPKLKNIDPKMVELIQNEIMDSGPKLTWNDIAGLEFAKNTIQEVVVWPMLRPDIFTGLRRPPKGILLFGPPGTGKTLIGKCIASQSGATFLSISSSSLTSKWVGDGEKMVRALFAVARVYQPAVVFIDEIDSLLSQRSDTEHESSRRIKTEFLVQLDGCASGEEDRILIIGATNRPQELDEAARRRLVKRLYIPLPECKARAEIIRNLLSKERHTLTDEDIEEVAKLTEGYSGADMKHVCQEASLGPIRAIPAAQIRDIDTTQVRAVNISDFKSALNRVKSTVSQKDLEGYIEWDQQFGCGSL